MVGCNTVNYEPEPECENLIVYYPPSPDGTDTICLDDYGD